MLKDFSNLTSNVNNCSVTIQLTNIRSILSILGFLEKYRFGWETSVVLKPFETLDMTIYNKKWCAYAKKLFDIEWSKFCNPKSFNVFLCKSSILLVYSLGTVLSDDVTIQSKRMTSQHRNRHRKMLNIDKYPTGIGSIWRTSIDPPLKTWILEAST